MKRYGLVLTKQNICKIAKILWSYKIKWCTGRDVKLEDLKDRLNGHDYIWLILTFREATFTITWALYGAGNEIKIDTMVKMFKENKKVAFSIIKENTAIHFEATQSEYDKFMTICEHELRNTKIKRVIY